jgi:hypothetical protein
MAARIAQRQGMPVSPATILRLVRRRQLAERATRTANDSKSSGVPSAWPAMSRCSRSLEDGVLVSLNMAEMNHIP